MFGIKELTKNYDKLINQNRKLIADVIDLQLEIRNSNDICESLSGTLRDLENQMDLLEKNNIDTFCEIGKCIVKLEERLEKLEPKKKKLGRPSKKK